MMMKGVFTVNLHRPQWCSFTEEANYPPHKALQIPLETGSQSYQRVEWRLLKIQHSTQCATD